MSAEVLRKAATQIRADHGEGFEFMLAVADWLDFEANCTDRAAKQFPSQQWDADERALAVAHAYMGGADV